jgi:hypothetical protein
MSTQEKIKKLLVETVYKKAAGSAAEQIIKSSEPDIHIPRAYEKLRGDWEWATGAPIPISMHDALEYYEKHVEERD